MPAPHEQPAAAAVPPEPSDAGRPVGAETPEQRLARSEALRRLAGDLARVGGWALEIPSRRQYWSEEIFDILEVPGEREPPVDEILARYPQADRLRLTEALDRCAQDGSPIDLELVVETFAGRRIAVRAIGEAERDADGAVCRIIGALQDVSDLHAARQHARAALERQALLLDAAQDAIIVRDLSHRISLWSSGAERVYGWSAAEVVGTDCRELLYDDPAAFDAAMAELQRAGSWVGELEHRDRTGRRLVVDARWTLVRSQGQPDVVLSLSTDVTEQRRTEQQLLRAQRMESLGTLAGGVAHDLNNVLTPILLAADMLRAQAPTDDQLGMLGIIQSSARRGADLVTQVLSFARGVEGERVPVDVTALLADVRAIIRDTFPKDIDLVVDVPERLGTTIGDSTQIQQVLLNLAVNARDAMPDGGRLTLAASVVALDAASVSANPEARPGEHLLIEVEDDGIGMPEDVRDRIFEPFFTTKPLGAGTGLGLSTAAAIVRSHAGLLHVYSEPGQGTRFRVYLPAATPAAGGPAQGVGEGGLPRGRGEVVLLVDDEEAVRTTTRQTLEAFGYRVLLAGDGAEAVSVYASHRDEVAVVVTDMMMPVMDGPATVHALRRLDPDLRIIGASGLHGDGRTSRAAAAGVAHFLPKPFSLQRLLELLAEVLADRR